MTVGSVSNNVDAGPWIYTDADNTLWDTNAVFANAQLQQLTRAERSAIELSLLIAGAAAIVFLEAVVWRLHEQRVRHWTALDMSGAW